MRSLLPLLVAAVLVVTATFPAGTDAWTPIGNLNSRVIQEVARFAVLVYNITHRTSLVFVSVVSGETEQPVGGGTNYRLVLTAAKAPGGSKGQYKCVVWGVPGSRSNTWKLLSFKPMN